MSEKRRYADKLLWQVFAEAVEETELSKAEIARRAGLDKSTVSSMMRGRCGSISSWDAVLAAAGIQVGTRRVTS